MSTISLNSLPTYGDVINRIGYSKITPTSKEAKIEIPNQIDYSNSILHFVFTLTTTLLIKTDDAYVIMPNEIVDEEMPMYIILNDSNNFMNGLTMVNFSHVTSLPANSVFGSIIMLRYYEDDKGYIGVVFSQTEEQKNNLALIINGDLNILVQLLPLCN